MCTATGKLAAYTAGAGIHPHRVIPVSLDAGTDNETLLSDPFYLGNRHARRRGQDYDTFIERYVQTVSALFPDALLHFAGLSPENARKVLRTYGHFQRDYAKQRSGATGASGPRPVRLADIIEGVAPTILVGASAVGGTFTREVVQAMCQATRRPLILPLSAPAAVIEATPADIITWSGGKALVATGIQAGLSNARALRSPSGS
jgi:malate dehydrogenase (oxaloacetate-decarboxylating)